MDAARLDALIAQLEARSAALSQPQQLQFPGGAPGLIYQANATTKVTVKVPVGTLSITIITSTGFTSLMAVGQTTRFPYLPIGAKFSSAQLFNVPWAVPPDDQCEITIVTGAGQAGTLFATASPTPGSIPIATEPWLVPNKRPVTQAGAGIVVPGILGQRCYLFGGFVAIRGVVAGGIFELASTIGTVYVHVGTDALGNFPFQFNGAALDPDEGLQVILVNAASNASVIDFAFSQA